MNEILKKRIEEAQVEFANKEYEVGDIDWDALYKGFFHGAEYAISHQWISVDEVLPENEDLVIIMYDNGLMKVRKGIYVKINKPICESIKITHWMPIPKLEIEK